jgi:hypothetical protein
VTGEILEGGVVLLLRHARFDHLKERGEERREVREKYESVGEKMESVEGERGGGEGMVSIRSPACHSQVSAALAPSLHPLPAGYSGGEGRGLSEQPR